MVVPISSLTFFHTSARLFLDFGANGFHIGDDFERTGAPQQLHALRLAACVHHIYPLAFRNRGIAKTRLYHRGSSIHLGDRSGRVPNTGDTFSD